MIHRIVADSQAVEAGRVAVERAGDARPAQPARVELKRVDERVPTGGEVAHEIDLEPCLAVGLKVLVDGAGAGEADGSLAEEGDRIRGDGVTAARRCSERKQRIWPQ